MPLPFIALFVVCSVLNKRTSKGLFLTESNRAAVTDSVLWQRAMLLLIGFHIYNLFVKNRNIV